MSSTTDPSSPPTSFSYWRGGLWLAAGCLGIGAAVIAIRLMSWPIVDPVPTPDDLFSEWDDAAAIELGDARAISDTETLPDLPPLPPIEFPADFPATPEPVVSDLSESGRLATAETTWATYESTSTNDEQPVWFAGTIEVIDDNTTAWPAPPTEAVIPAGIRR